MCYIIFTSSFKIKSRQKSVVKKTFLLYILSKETCLANFKFL